MRHSARVRLLLVIPVLLCALFAGGAVRRVQDTCGPFTDVSALFCPYVLEAYYTGITAGTSPTTFSPDMPITRGQAAVFAAKGLSQAVARSSRRAALGQWWTTTPHYDASLGFTPLGDIFLGQPCSDGADIWVPSESGAVSRIRASDGKILGTWTSPSGNAALCAMGKVFVVGLSGLYMIDPAGDPGPATLVTSDFGGGDFRSLTFDGNRIWVTNPIGQCACDPYPPGAIAIITPGAWTSQVITTGSLYPWGIVFDGTNMWMTAIPSGLYRLDAAGSIVQTVPTGTYPGLPIFDGANIWVPSSEGITVVRAVTGDVVATLTGKGVGGVSAAFDGSRVLVLGSGNGTVWDAQTLSLLGSFSTLPLSGAAAVSDGINFWLTLADYPATGGLGRF